MSWPSWEIGRALGIPIRVHSSWFLVFLFVTWSLATGYLPASLPGLSGERYWAMGGVSALLLFLSVLLHELGHSYVALRYRIPIGQITLFIFGGVAQMRMEPPSPRAEFLIAIAGPAVSVVLGTGCLGLVFMAEELPSADAWQGLIMLGLLLGTVNLQLGLFNLIPGFPLDGGRVLRAGLWAWGKDFYRATSQAATIGLGFGALLGLLGASVIAAAITGAVPGSLASNGGWMMFLGAFLFATALTSRRHAAIHRSLAAVPVQQIMVRTVVTIPSDASLDDAVNRYFMPYGYGGFPVVSDTRVVGLLGVDEVQAVPQSRWPWQRVEQVMRPIAPVLTIAPDATVAQAVEQMSREGSDRLVVVQDEQLVGLVTRSAVAHFLQLRQASNQ